MAKAKHHCENCTLKGKTSDKGKPIVATEIVEGHKLCEPCATLPARLRGKLRD